MVCFVILGQEFAKSYGVFVEELIRVKVVLRLSRNKYC